MAEKPHRLLLDLYRGHRAIAFTCCIYDRVPYFVHQNNVRSIEDMLRTTLIRHKTNAHVYLFMPDHLHLLLEGIDTQADLYKCMTDFKQKSGFWLSKNADVRWQKDFYDHILREDEPIEKHIRYILKNPERKNLIENWKLYPHKGSTLYDFNQW